MPKSTKKRGVLNDWVSVNDRLPDIKQGSIAVIIYSPFGHANDRLKGSYFYIPKRGGRGKFGAGNKVTHWMEMPKPPTIDEKIDTYNLRTKSDTPSFQDGCIGYKDGRDVHGEKWSDVRDLI